MRLVIAPLLLACVAIVAAADSTPSPATDPAAMQKAMDLMSKTGPEHLALRRMVGEWVVAETMWMGPGGAAMSANGKATISEVLGGKWFRQDYQGQMMGQPFTGVLISGYDSVEKQYVATWVDSMSTVMGVLKGESPDGGKSITYTSRMEHCPMNNGTLDTR
jgi:hypothetical protein